MPYIITDGTSYCHRTRTQAVELVADISQATRFRNEQSAQKLLARATKKLKGFELVEIASRSEEAKSAQDAAVQEKADEVKADVSKADHSASAQKETDHKDGARKNSSRRNARRAKKPAAKADTQIQEQIPYEKAPAAQDAQAEETSHITEETPAETAAAETVTAETAAVEADREATTETHEGNARKRRRSHRGGRRNRTQNDAARDTAVTAESEGSAVSSDEETAATDTAAETTLKAAAPERAETEESGEAASQSTESGSPAVSDAQVSQTEIAMTDDEDVTQAAPEGADANLEGSDASAVENASAAANPPVETVVDMPVAETEAAASADTEAAKADEKADEPETVSAPVDASSLEASQSIPEDTLTEETNAEADKPQPVSHAFRKKDRRSRFDSRSSMTDNTASLWGEPVDLSKRTHEKKSVQTQPVRSTDISAQTEASVQTQLTEDAGTSSQTAVAAQAEKPKYPTSFTRKKKAASTWSIEDATNRVFGRGSAQKDTIENADQSETVPALSFEQAEPGTKQHSKHTEPAAKQYPGHAEDEAKQYPKHVETKAKPINGQTEAVQENAQPDETPAAEAAKTPSVSENADNSRSRRRRSRHGKSGDELRLDNAPATAAEQSTDVSIESTAPAAAREIPVPAKAQETVKAEPEHAPGASFERSSSRISYGNERHSRSNSRTSGSSRSPKRHSERENSASTASRRRLFTQQERNLIYNRSEGHCGICGRFIPLEEYTIDHIIPLSKGGTNDLDNLQACCGFCNKAKDDSQGDDFFSRIQRIYLYQAELRYPKKQYKKLKKAIKELDESKDDD